MPQLEIGDFAPQLVWLAISFITLYVLMARVALPRIGDVLNQRRERIDRDIAEAERLKAETERALQAYERELAEARARAHKIAREAREKLDAEVAGERAKVEAEIAAKMAEAEARIAEAKAKAMAEVDEIAREAASAIVAQLISVPVAGDELEKALAPAKSGTPAFAAIK